MLTSSSAESQAFASNDMLRHVASTFLCFADDVLNHSTRRAQALPAASEQAHMSMPALQDADSLSHVAAQPPAERFTKLSCMPTVQRSILVIPALS